MEENHKDYDKQVVSIARIITICDNEIILNITKRKQPKLENN